MPPVRWKKFFHVMAIVIQIAASSTTDAQHMHQSGFSSKDPYSQSSDGWVPIVSSQRRQHTGYDPAITQYANPSQTLDLVKADVLNLETTTPYFRKTSMYYKVPVKNGPKGTKTGTKTKQILKTHNGAYITSPGGYHGAHMPLNSNQQALNRQSLPQKKLYVAKKIINAAAQVKPRKPVRSQGPAVAAYSTKSEVYSAAPNTGYSIVKSIQPNAVHTRETQGLGVFGNNNPFASSTNPHIDFTSNRFTLPPQNNVYEQSNQNLFFARPVQDDFSRNLVPPPISRIHHGNSKQNAIHAQAKPHEISLSAPSANFEQFGNKFSGINQLQAPSFQNPVRVKTNEQAIDVQVTKEQVKQFNSDLQSPFNTQNSFSGGFVFNNSPRPLTYEVTEGTRFESPDFQFRPQPNQAYFKLGNAQTISNLNHNGRPGLLFQSLPGSTTRPPFSVSPLVDLSEPGFLPTPYKIENAVIPTSQSLTDVSTVFAQVTQRNKFRTNQQAQKNHGFFEVQDISTHFPVLGTVQDIGGEEGTEPPSEENNNSEISKYENSEITNEITTHQEIEKETLKPSVPTKPTLSRDPTRTRLSQRRRKPSTTTTTESPVVETYEPIRSQESDSGSIPSSEAEDTSRERERPHRRRRPRPNQTRIKDSNEDDSENVPPPRRPVSEENGYRRPISDESRLRGRHRFRPRGKYTTQSSEEPTRPRIRTHRPEPVSYEDVTEVSLEHNSVENQYGSYSDEKTAENHEFDKVEGSREQSTAAPFIEEIHHNVRDKSVETTRATTSTTTEETVSRESSTEFHLPENEVDYTTPTPVRHEEPSTTQSTTTTTSPPETTTTKFVRARIRPNKFDSAHRPKFSVKDYRQKLDHLTSTTQPTTTDGHRNTQSNLRLRFPQRTRSKLNSATTTTQSPEEDSATEQTTMKSKFKPKDPRFHTTTESESITTEKSIKSVNTRMRPFGKSKLNSEITTTPAPKVSIKPNLFSARRRVQYPSLRTRIQGKNKKNETEESTTEKFPGEGEILVSTEMPEVSSTDPELNRAATAELAPTESSDVTTEDAIRNDFSQRVSDLTSSFIDTPGMFKSVSPNSRKVPSYFTISTDDPILPIEAFFPNLKQENKEKLPENTSDDT